jgi:uncharacterized protein
MEVAALIANGQFIEVSHDDTARVTTYNSREAICSESHFRLVLYHAKRSGRGTSQTLLMVEPMKLRVVVIPLLFLYPLYAGVMVTRQAQILFPASSTEHHALSVTTPTDGQLIDIPTSFGHVRAFYQPAVGHSGSRPAIVYSHGNFECIQESFALMRPLVNAGIDTLQLEFPGFCGADGTPSFANIVETETAGYDWLAKQTQVDPTRIIAMGYSIGGGAAGELVSRRPIRALLLLSTFTSMADMARRYALPAFLVHYPFDSRLRLQDFSGPIFIEHGRRDHVIPFEMGQALAASKAGTECVALDCGHDDCHFDSTLFKSRVPDWLAAKGILPEHRE